ncbi:piggyBac transposable element-derived protein 4-like [Anneissia japonica]|uniref:piggyBac transposable element-derived protein 4-like n=1 Tax=Anneissia japonica TaxID=1529436 RepID=UPI0014258BE9|nr:piggyBac transposable element-derived protein 4-like [Anneissia japonica]
MSRNRFQLLLRCLHLVDDDAAPPRDNPAYILTAFYPSREVSIDESVIAFKGRVGFKTYHPKKPHKRGMTAWTLSDARTGYVINQNLHVRQGPVMGLCQAIRGKNHHVYMDNYFSSPQLFRQLETLNCGACGTLRTDRIGTPEAIQTANPAVGEAVFEHDGNQLFIAWKDKRKVHLLTNLHNSNTYDKRRRQRNGPDFKEITKPYAIELYTQFMGGVDRADLQIWMYLHIHRSMKWWKKVFIYLLEGYTRRESQPGRRSTDPPQRLTEHHQLVFTSRKTPSGKTAKPDCVVCSDKTTGRRHQTEMICKECNQPMCPVPCFWRYHHLADYKATCTKEYHHPH